MTLEQLRIFVEVAEREHMTKAAEVLNITQSAVSAAIAMLEAQHAVPLFHRVGRHIELTDAGRVFLGEARAVVGSVVHAERVLSEFNHLKKGKLHLVASQTIASYWLPKHLVAFHKSYPKITIDLAVANTEQAAKSVLAGTAEIGFIEGIIREPTLLHWPIAHDQLVLVGVDHPPAVDETWIRNARWIAREHGSGTRSTFEDALRQRGIPPEDLHIALTLPSNESVRSAVEARAGVAVLSELVVARAVDAGILRAYALELPTRPFFALLHKERYKSKAVQALFDCITENTL